MKEYLVSPVTTGYLSGALDPRKLQDLLNAHGRQGWKFVRSIHETKKSFLFFGRDAHFVVFERDV